MGTLVVDLLPRWNESWARERARRLLPVSWLEDQRDEAQTLNELWIDMLAASPHCALAADDR
jgi:hypothetical protein